MKENKKVIGWWSGGVTSAVACKLAIDLYGVDNVDMIMMDTKNEDPDTYRFKKDCEKWYEKEISVITALEENESIQDVWLKFKSLNVANGAICSSTLKRDLRLTWEKDNKWDYQVFGFDIDETKRAKAMTLNYPDTKPIYPLLLYGYSKKMCIDILNEAGIEIPRTYKYGFHNNNCFQTGCVQGGIGYWQKMGRDFPDKFDKMAEMEHKLTNRRGSPVTMLKDQSKEAKELVEKTGDKTKQFVFLKPHPDYPEIKDISMMKGREPKPLVECNGFCSTNDLNANPTDKEINYQTEFEF